ncbi:MAG: benzoate-CoA ligase family protein [bacterium]
MNLFDAIFDQESPDKVAILFEQQRITYSELRERTIELMRALRFLEIEQGDRVALLLHDSPEFISSFIGICSYGAIAVPINMGLRLDEQRAILNDCAACLAVVEGHLCDELLKDAANVLPHLVQVVIVDRAHEGGITASTQNAPGEPREDVQSGVSKLWSFANLTRQAEITDGISSQVGDDSLRGLMPFPGKEEKLSSFIFYTSGSTGEPKGAVHRLSDIFYTNQTYCHEVLKPRDGDRMFSSSRLPFSYGFGNAVSFPLLNGCATILCREKPTPEVINRVFAEHKPTIFFGVPVIYRLLLDHHRNIAPLASSSLRLCVSAGEALPAQLGAEIESTFGVEVLDGIGSTEMLHMWMSNHEGEVRLGSSGKLLKGYEARLLDEEGNAVQVGAEGNLWVKGGSAALGYWDKPELTAKTFVDGWVQTGDLYVRDTDGYWYHMGRSDDCFKSSGQWVSPVEVEGVLLKHAGVNRAAVVEDFDSNDLPCVCAFVIKAEGSGDNADLEQELRILVREHLPRHKQPRRYVFVDDLPYTATGKIQRFKLREAIGVSSSKFKVSS